jgi:hypothetical protein
LIPTVIGVIGTRRDRVAAKQSSRSIAFDSRTRNNGSGPVHECPKVNIPFVFANADDCAVHFVASDQTHFDEVIRGGTALEREILNPDAFVRRGIHGVANRLLPWSLRERLVPADPINLGDIRVSRRKTGQRSATGFAIRQDVADLAMDFRDFGARFE